MDPQPHTVVLQVPAEARFLRVARMTAAALGADLDLDMDELDEIKVAVDELGSALLAPEGSADLDLRYEVADDSIVVRGQRQIVGSVELDPFAEALLDIVADDFELTAEGDVHRFRVRKARSARAEET